MRTHYPEHPWDGPARHWEPLCKRTPASVASMSNAIDQVTCRWCLRLIQEERDAKDDAQVGATPKRSTPPP